LVHQLTCRTWNCCNRQTIAEVSLWKTVETCEESSKMPLTRCKIAVHEGAAATAGCHEPILSFILAGFNVGIIPSWYASSFFSKESFVTQE
jgi:hypothetical protein